MSYINSFSSLPGYIVVEKNNVSLGPKVENHDYADLLKKHWGLLLVVLISALVVVLTPVIGYVSTFPFHLNNSPKMLICLFPSPYFSPGSASAAAGAAEDAVGGRSRSTRSTTPVAV